jgi:cell division septum initiation protein DivIVA
MAEKKFLSWIGFKDNGSSVAPISSLSSEEGTGSQSNIARIRELENQLAELRSRRDLTTLTKEEFEILASETAMTMIKTAQARESKATSAAQRLINESNRAAKELVVSAENKARQLLSQAESRGRKYIDAAENDAKETLLAASKSAEEIVTAKRREASGLTAAAKREAEQLVSGAVNDISDYRAWLSTAISEAERLHRIQTQSLNAAQQAIEQTRQRLASAFEKLASLQSEIDANLDESDLPKNKNYVRSGAKVMSDEESPAPVAKRTSKKVVPQKKKPVKKPVKKAVKKDVKKSAPKKKAVAKRK